MMKREMLRCLAEYVRQVLFQPFYVIADVRWFDHVETREGGNDIDAAEFIIGGIADEDVIDGFAGEELLIIILKGLLRGVPG